MSLHPYSLIRAGAVPRKEIEGEIKRAVKRRGGYVSIPRVEVMGRCAVSGYAIALTVGIIALA